MGRLSPGILISTPSRGAGAPAAARLFAEIFSATTDEVVAYRGATRWMPAFEQIALPNGATPPRLRERGVYLITGGLGGIGLTLAADLARFHQARLVLISRSGFPDRSQWDSLAAEPDSRRGRQARILCEIETTGAALLIAQADVADEAEMREVTARAEQKFGPICGVIHAAGVAGGGVLARKTERAVHDVLRAKVEGAAVLDRICESRELDFMALCSSIAGWLGGFGQADYCAANLFLDAFAEARTRRGKPTFSILWDAWRDVGMAVETEAPPELRRLREEELRRYALCPADGAAAFRNALRLGLPQVVVSTRDFPARYAARHGSSNGRIEKMGTAARGARHPRPALAQPFAPPRDQMERQMAALWAEHLGFEQIGIEDDYFELGGDSLVATQLVSRLRDALGVTVPVRWLFEAPTVAELADRLRTALSGEAAAECVVESAAQHIPIAPRDQPLPLSFAQQRLWFLDQLEGPSPIYNMPGALDLSGSLDYEALRFALAEIVRRHEALRTCLVAHEGVPVQRILQAVPASAFPLPVIDLRQCADPDGEAKRLAGAEALTPFDLARDSGLRATLLRRGESDWTLLLTLHHSAADGWSIDVLVRELVALYGACREGRPSPLPELAIQYADFALWQRGYLSGARLQRQLEFWRQRLAGVPECLHLPGDRPRPARQSYRGAVLGFSLDQSLTAGIKELSRRSGGPYL